LSIVEERFNNAKKEYEKIKKKVKYLDELQLKSFEEFVK
jgi:hypothetical protein